MPRQIDDPIKPLTDQLEAAIAYLKSGTGEKEALFIIEKVVYPRVKRLEAEASHFAAYFLWATLTAAIFIAVSGVLATYIAVRLRKLKWISKPGSNTEVIAEPQSSTFPNRGYKGPKEI